MSTESELYEKIGGTLYNSSPENAKTIFLDAELSPEGDHVKFIFEYIDDAGNEDCFDPEDDDADNELMDYLIQLRDYYVANNLTNGRPAWHSCRVTLDVEEMKFAIEFRYDDEQ